MRDEIIIIHARFSLAPTQSVKTYDSNIELKAVRFLDKLVASFCAIVGDEVNLLAMF